MADALRDEIERVLLAYHCSETVDEEGAGLQLVDVLTPREADDITPGLAEVHGIADELAAHLSEQFKSDSERPGSFRAGWCSAIEAALCEIPGGDTCRPADIDDAIRELGRRAVRPTR